MSKAKKKKILMVEDDSAQSFMYQLEFRNFGYDFIIVEDGTLAVETIVKEKPDLILMDLLIGKVSGLDVIKALKAKDETKDIRIIVMSNYKKKGLEEECATAGAIDYWVKSDYVPKQIVEKVANVL